MQKLCNTESRNIVIKTKRSIIYLCQHSGYSDRTAARISIKLFSCFCVGNAAHIDKSSAAVSFHAGQWRCFLERRRCRAAATARRLFITVPRCCFSFVFSLLAIPRDGAQFNVNYTRSHHINQSYHTWPKGIRTHNT